MLGASDKKVSRNSYRHEVARALQPQRKESVSDPLCHFERKAQVSNNGNILVLSLLLPAKKSPKNFEARPAVSFDRADRSKSLTTDRCGCSLSIFSGEATIALLLEATESCKWPNIGEFGANQIRLKRIESRRLS